MTFSEFLSIILSFSILFVSTAILYKTKRAPGSLLILLSLTILATVEIITIFWLVPDYGNLYSSQFVFTMRMTEYISMLLVSMGIFRVFRFYYKQ